MRYRFFRIVPAFLLVFGSVFAQEYRVEVTNIQVWVKATDKSGKTITGLTSDDFEILEDDVKQPATCFEETGLSGTERAPTVSESLEVSAPRPQAEQETTKKFVLFLDLYNTIPLEYGQIKPKMQEFVDQLKDRKAEIMVAALMPTGKLGIIAPFTRNTDAVHQLLDHAPTNEKRDQQMRTNLRNIELVFSNMTEQVADTMFRNAYRLAQQYADLEKSQAEYSLAALESFAAHIQEMHSDEHAVVLFVSGGFNADPGRMYYDIIDRIAESRGYSIGSSNWAMAVPNSIRQINFDVRREVQNSIGRLNRYNVTVYSVNTRGMYVPGGNITAFDRSFFIQDNSYLQDFQESLAQIAEETGGTAFYNSQNFQLGFDRVLEDLDHQYVLCFSPPEHPKKGEYHRIKVVAKKPGITLRYRQGYID